MERIAHCQTRGGTRDLLSISTIALAASIAAGCGSDGPPTQVCHATDGGFEVVEVAGDSDLQSHLDHGDEVFGTGLDESCQGAITFRVDPEVTPHTQEISGLHGGAPRRVAALKGPNGGRDEFVENEIEVRFENEAELESFLTLYDGTVLRDDTAFIANDDGEIEAIQGGLDGWYLVKIGTSASNLTELPRLAADAGMAGSFSASSGDALRTLAIHLRENERGASANFVVKSDALWEHTRSDPALVPGLSAHVDMAQQWWMTDDDDSSIPGEQGLSVGLAAAFDYLRHIGHPPRDGSWTPARVAILDIGFDLDGETGLGNPDYNNTPDIPPLQIDLVDLDDRAGGIGAGTAGWHGQGTFGVCCAYPRNLFGGAGTGGEYVRPILIKLSMTSAGTAEGVRTAMLMGASVINMSFGWYCTNMCPAGTTRMERALRDAADGKEIAVFASAGNGINNDGTNDANIDGMRKLPCDARGVICVGAIDRNGDNVWNWGDAVDIWAPTNTRSTVSPDRADCPGCDENDWGLDEVRIFTGTSAASPFAAGIAGLIKSIAPEYPGYLIEQILKETANESTDPLVLTGYVDALRAVQQVRENPPPTVKLAFLQTGRTYSPMREREFSAFLTDEPSAKGFVGTVEFYSDIDGLLCAVEGEGGFLSCNGALRTEGQHVITAVATDEFGASATSEPVEITVANHAPVVVLASPTDGSSHYADQRPSFRTTVYDADGEEFDVFCPAPDGGACTEWYSDLDGLLAATNGSEDALNFTSALSRGTHTITATARDAFGASASQSVTVHVEPGRGVPTARILTDLGDFTWGESMVLHGTGSDPEDGALSASSLQWFSNVDGFLGTGEAPTVTLSGPRCEGQRVHIITLLVTDSDGNTSTDAVRVTFTYAC